MNGMPNLKAILEKSTSLTHDTDLYTFSLSEGTMTATPGQFVSIQVPSGDGVTTINRAYSIAGFEKDATIDVAASTFTTRSFDLLIRTVATGKATPILKTLPIGTVLSMMGPSGGMKLLPLANTIHSYRLCASATGLAPFRTFLQWFAAAQQFPEIAVFWGLRAASDIHLLDEMQNYQAMWSAHGASLEVHTCLSRATASDVQGNTYESLCHVGGHVQDFFSVSKAAADARTYICGGKDFVLSIKDAVAQQFPSSAIHSERFY